MSTVSPPPVEHDQTATGSRGLDLVLRFRALGLLLALVLLVAVTALVNPSFLSVQSIRDLLLAAAITVLLACRSEEHTSELQSRGHLVCRLLLEKKNKVIVVDILLLVWS